MPDDFTCQGCGETFVKAWTDEEAIAESDALFGAIDDPAVVCDGCFRKMGLGGERMDRAALRRKMARLKRGNLRGVAKGLRRLLS